MQKIIDDFLWGLSNCDKVVVVLTGVGEKEFSTKEIYESIDELKIKADKWVEKETPYNPKESGYGLAGYYVICKCSEKVYADEHIESLYCSYCGQKIELSE